jgi:hypothetical protein
VFILVSIITALYTANYYEKKSQISEVNQQLDEIEILLLQCFKEQENFFNFESSNEEFFLTQESHYINLYENNFNTLHLRLDSLKNKGVINGTLEDELIKIEKMLFEFDSLFSQMRASILKRGFRNYGIEGKMRAAIHQLENIDEIELVDVLMLRRIEKDYILRQDPVYLDRHKNLINKILAKLIVQNNSRSSRKAEIRQTLQKYAHFFNQLALYERIIGLKANSGFKQKLNQKTNQLTHSFQNLKKESIRNQASLMKSLNYSIAIFWIIYLLI